MTVNAPARPHARGGLGQAMRDGLIIAGRNLRRVPRVPELAIFAILQSIMFVLLFAFVFGGAIPLPGGGSYREFLMPGIFAQNVACARWMRAQWQQTLEPSAPVPAGSTGP